LHWIGFLADTAHMAIEEEDALKARRTSAPWLKPMQTSQNGRGTPGSGTLIDWQGAFRTLDDIRYGGCAHESFAWQEDPDVSAKMRCWRDLASSPEALALG
jgi:D-psicose/D-tagatose/L-ribulose 3-epimerase